VPELLATCELWIDGVRYPDGSTGSDPADPFAVTGLTIVWGRETTLDQPQPAQCTFTVLDPPGGAVRFDDTVKLGSAVAVYAAVPGGTRQQVYGGRVTDLAAAWDDAAGAGSCQVAVADTMSDLANRFVGAEPWTAESLVARAQRILAAVGVSAAGLNVAARLQPLQVSRMDVDRQAAAGLLEDLAASAGGVLWTAVQSATQTYFYFEDPWARASLVRFVKDPGTGLWHPAIVPGGNGYPLPACQVLRDPVTWARAVTDLITRATVRWLDQTTSPGTTERSVQVIDTAAEASFGARGVSVGTILTTSADASTVASGIMAAHPTTPQWRAAGLTWDLADTVALDPATLDLAGKLLSNTARMGLALSLSGLPYWTPTGAAVSLYVEGGTYTFDGGRWLLSLLCSPATGLGTSITFDQVDEAVRYVDVDRAVRYLDMIGVGP
jgi:hypothetical protein